MRALNALLLLLPPPIVGQEAAAEACSADFNGSGAIDVSDLLLCLGAFGRDAAADPVVQPFDLDSSGRIGVSTRPAADPERLRASVLRF